ncbi:MAG: NAD+ synthase (glutamine-hydrolyzing) [Thermoproteota archaeon]|jgi:NAD+ synthase (glutamine-hydrolysing)
MDQEFKIHLHQTQHQIADFKNIFNYLEVITKKNFKQDSAAMHLFPELFLTGYPLQDLCLQKSFITQYQSLINAINSWSVDGFEVGENSPVFLIGGLDYELNEKGLPLSIKNVIFKLILGQKLIPIYTKQLLPTYDIFDEKKYFSAGSESQIFNYQGKSFGLLICEDMWASSFHNVDPSTDLKNKVTKDDINLDALINLSASPYSIGKSKNRHSRAAILSKEFGCPFIYVNRVGGEDEILFDGHSFVNNKDQLLVEGKTFTKDHLVFSLNTNYDCSSTIDLESESSGNTWEDLFNSALDTDAKTLKLKDLSDSQTNELLRSLCFGVQEYAQKAGFNKFLVALSGGMDSALVLAILQLSLKEGQSIEAIYMPSQFSSPLSYDLSLELCKNLGVSFKTFPIKFLHSATKNAYLSTFDTPLKGLSDENVQSRLRGTLIYTHSNQSGAMVINTSNKSELAVGYSTQYGDSVGAISMLGDLYKSEVFHLANYINRNFNNIIPQEIIDRPPTAELREGQIDTDSLPPYEVLDAILEGILSYQYDIEDLTESKTVKNGFSAQIVKKVFNLYRKTEYKRTQFCPIIKVKAKSFGFGYRIPTSKHSEFYLGSSN